jgi:hypothetical protein
LATGVSDIRFWPNEDAGMRGIAKGGKCCPSIDNIALHHFRAIQPGNNCCTVLRQLLLTILVCCCGVVFPNLANKRSALICHEPAQYWLQRQSYGNCAVLIAQFDLRLSGAEEKTTVLVCHTSETLDTCYIDLKCCN